MKIISFAKTKEEIKTHKKWVTRRLWKDSYAKLFKQGDICKAYDRSPRNGGEQIETIFLTMNPFKQWLHEMTIHDLIAEGGRWKTVDDFINEFNGDKLVWVVYFNYLKVK